MPRMLILPALPSNMSDIRFARYWAWKPSFPGPAIRRIPLAPSTMAICRARKDSECAFVLPETFRKTGITTMKLFLLAAMLSLVSTNAMCDDNIVSMTLQDHKFMPAEIHVKANRPTTVMLTNNDDQS